ncbi:adenylate/guanylate cyclase domain-containing protein [Sphingosinicella sp. LHD-64]|uniref:adenylate/guanylate cyclase domain-containing protein n=1 Tax=Sphingosinicella sp. LHD-64 TaxID=3072139 RepID=UPI00280DC904|nr:adenylate/guanylate cyclase domain-containing protein [Sphingosinicella sp. LHD-64]MDQ8756675.1 adenylate/guanylate cyclase domain-containing protein [Sphingosinicella sp. LHD-64]
MGALMPRFADPGTERAFVEGERSGRGRAIRALILVGIATLLSYIVLNPMHFPREGVIAYTGGATLLMALLAGFFALTRTRFYLENSWTDVPAFLLLAAGIAALTAALNGQATVTGFPPHAMALVQMGILIVFASVLFAGTFRLFLLSAFLLAAGFAGWLTLHTDAPGIARIYTLTNFSTFFIFALYFNWDIERRAREVFAANRALEAERAKTEELLYNVLPQEVAARLRAGEAVADSFSDVTVVFVDLVDFSSLAKRLSPGHLVQLLNACFSEADRCAERHGLEKVKTIGDAYLAVAGGMASRPAGAGDAIAFARDLVAALRGLAEESGIDLRARVGAHTGPVVGGVIGSRRLAYDYWGDTMNVASRLQGAAPPGGIAVSEATYFQTKALLAYRAETHVLKGIGEVATYVADLGEAASATPRARNPG